MKKMIIVVCAILILSACKNVKTETFAYEKPRLEVENLVPLKIEPTEFLVITEENASEVFSMMKDNGIDPVLFGLTDVMYERRSMNYGKIIIFVTKQSDVIKAYKEYYEPETAENE